MTEQNVKITKCWSHETFNLNKTKGVLHPSSHQSVAMTTEWSAIPDKENSLFYQIGWTANWYHSFNMIKDRSKYYVKSN